MRPWSGFLNRVPGLWRSRGSSREEGVDVKDFRGGSKAQDREGRRSSLAGIGGNGVAGEEGTVGPVFGGLVG